MLKFLSVYFSLFPQVLSILNTHGRTIKNEASNSDWLLNNFNNILSCQQYIHLGKEKNSECLFSALIDNWLAEILL